MCYTGGERLHVIKLFGCRFGLIICQRQPYCIIRVSHAITKLIEAGYAYLVGARLQSGDYG